MQRDDARVCLDGTFRTTRLQPPGNLTSIEIRCEHKRFEFEVSDDVEWNIPDTLGNCNVSVYGHPDATFDVLMPPA
jgi:hypothetical protein